MAAKNGSYKKKDDGSDHTTAYGADSCARELLEVIPEISQLIRSEMRANRALGLTVPQFRALAFIRRNEGASLNMLAECLGLSPAGASSVADGLVERGFVKRGEGKEDRRRIELSLTPTGRRDLERARDATLEHLGKKFSGTSRDDRETVVRAMSALRRALLS
jgi:DNA-binding MarR family transcriptional regulator